MNLYSLDILNFSTEFFLGISILFLFNFGLVYEREKVSPELCIQAKIIFIWLGLLLFNQMVIGDVFFLLNSYIIDGWSMFLKGVLISLGFFYFFFLKRVSFEFITLVLVFHLASFILLSSHNFLVFYLALELSSFVLYLLVASRTESLFSTESGLKYFVLGSFSSILLLLGISLCYGLVGSLDFSDIFLFGWELEWKEGQTYLMVSLFFILVGLCFKLGVAPFHFWIPDVYQGSDYLVLLLLVVFSKIGIFGSLIRIVYDVFSFEFERVSFFFFFLGFFSLVIGTLGALWQINLKRLIGYSGISHMGFLFFGLSTGTSLGLISSLLYFLFYLVLNMGWILCLMALNVDKLDELRGWSSSWLGLYLVLTMFSIAGIPPLGGFFMKLYLFFSLVQIEFWVGLFLLIIGSVVSAFYYLRLVEIFYFSPVFLPKKDTKLGWSEAYVIVFFIYLNIFFLFFQNFFFLTILNQ